MEKTVHSPQSAKRACGRSLAGPPHLTLPDSVITHEPSGHLSKHMLHATNTFDDLNKLARQRMALHDTERHGVVDLLGYF